MGKVLARGTFVYLAKAPIGEKGTTGAMFGSSIKFSWLQAVTVNGYHALSELILRISLLPLHWTYLQVTSVESHPMIMKSLIIT